MGKNKHLGYKMTNRFEDGKFIIDVKVRTWYWYYLNIWAFTKCMFK